jgi:lipopolysaccharide export system protein LptA
MTQNENKIYSDYMKIFYNKNSKDIKKAIITGHVKIKNSKILANCTKAFFYKDKNTIILKGNVKVMQQGNIFYGDELVIDMSRNKTFLKGGKKRINTIFSGEK